MILNNMNIIIFGEREREVDPRSGSTSSKFDFYISLIVGENSVDVCCCLLFVDVPNF